MVHPSAVPPPPPPGPPGGQGRENDYEEIGPPARRQAAQHAMNISASRQPQQQQQQQTQHQGRTGAGDGKERVHCDLCGSSASAVRCDKCSGQAFCLSCDDMYHRHPKRSAHVRKAVDSIQRPFRPPLPPKSDLQPPVPPPRRNKRFGLFGKKEQSPALPRKESASGVMGSLKRFMGVRPLPPPPTQKGGLTSVWEEPSVQPLPANLGRPQPSVQRSLSRGSADSGLPPSDTSAALPVTVAAMNDAERHQRQTGMDQRDMDRNPVPVRPRSQSVTANMSSQQQQQLQQQQQQQAWMYPQDHHHHQHNDMLQGFVTTRRGQSYRAGWPGGMLAAGGSVCDVTSPPPGHHMAHPGFHHPHMMHAQSLAQLGCPTCHGHGPPVWYPNDPPDGHLHRFPSNSSLSAAHGGGGYPASPTVGGGGRFVSQRDIRQPSPAPSVRSGRAARPRRLARSQMELSRYPTDSDDPGSGVESDDESDQPPEETAPIPWACPHCTFQNSAGTRVCAMCCRTAPAVAAGQQRGAQRRRRRRRFPRGPLPPGSPAAPRRPRDPSPGSASHGGRERSDRSMSRGPSMGRELGRTPDTTQLADDMQSLKLEAAGRDRRPSDAAAAAVAPRRVSVASVSAAEGAAMFSAGVGTSDREASVPPPERESGGTGGQKRTQSTGTSPPPQTIATQTNEDPALYSEGSLPRTGSHRSLTGGYGEYEPLRYGGRQPRTLKRTQSFQAFGHQERQERADPWLSYGALGSRFQGRSSSKSSVHSAASDSRAFAAYGSGASSRGESPARFGSERGHSRHHSYAGETARKPADGSDYLVGLEEVMLNRSSDMTANQGMELVLMLRDAEKHNFSPEDLQIALNHCSERPPVGWLLDNLDSMIETVCTLATNYGHERPENDVGTISNREARDALRLHKGNVWSAVTECVEQRRKKYSQLAGRGSFSREDIITALTANHGSVEAAYLDLNRTQLKPFLMRIWGPPQGVEVNEGAPQGRPEVTPPPGGQTEVKANGKTETAGMESSVAPQADGKASVEPQTEEQKPAASGDEVKVAPVTPGEVKVNPKVVSPPVLATAKADITDSGSRSDQCSTLSSDLDSDDDEACKSKDYITPPTSPLVHRSNKAAKPQSDSGLTRPTTSSPTSSLRPSESASASGPDPALAAPQPFSSPLPACSSPLDVSPSSGVYETVATRPAAEAKRATQHAEEKKLREKPAGSQMQDGEKPPKTSTESESKTVQPTPQNEKQDVKNGAIPQVQPESPYEDLPGTLPQSDTTRSTSEVAAPMAARPKERTRSPVARPAVLSDRDSSEDYEPAVYGDLLVTRAAEGATGIGSGQKSSVKDTEEHRSAKGALPSDDAGQRTDLVASPPQEKDQLASQEAHTGLTKTATDVRTSQSPSAESVSSMAESTTSAKYSIVKRPRPVTPLQDELPATEEIAKPRDGTDSDTSGGIAKQLKAETPPPAAVSSAPVAGAAPAAQTRVTALTESATRSAGGTTPLGDSANGEPHERRSSDSSSTSSASTDVTEREQLPRRQTAGWVTSNLYAKPADGAPRPAGATTAVKTEVSEAYDTPQPTTSVTAAKKPSGRAGEGPNDEHATETASTSASGSGASATWVAADDAASAEASSDAADTTYEVVSSTEARAASPMELSKSPAVSRSSLSPSLSPPPGPVIASSRQNLSPSERLELAKRVICNHVQRQRPSSGASAVPGTSSEGRPGSTSPQPPPIHHGPAGPYTPTSTDEIPDIEDGEDSADGAATGPVHRPRTLRHVTGDLTPASESSGEEAGGATAGSHVVFTSSDSLSEGYEAVVSVRFQPGDGRGGGVRSATRSPMPAAPLVASSSAESLSRSDHQAAPQSRQQTALPASRQMTPQAGAAAASQEVAAAEGAGEGAATDADPRRPAETEDGSTQMRVGATGSPATRAESSATGSAAERSSSGESVSSRSGQPSATATGAHSKPAPGQTSEASHDSDSSDSDSAEATAAARPSDVDVEALKEGLKNGRCNVLRRNSAERQKVQRRASRLLRSGRAQSQAEAEMASQLMALKFPADESLQAATQCSSLYAAVSFLHQECELCAGRCSAKELVAMTHCTHRCCVSCAQAYFTQRIKERPLADLRCPFCNEPDLTSEEIASDYFSHLDIMLKTLVPPEIHSLFHKKLFERAMMKDPNFKWCPKCSSGFIAPARQQKLHCPDCRTVSCALCAKTWTGQHEGVSCEKFAMWQQHNDPDYQSAGLERHLADSGISCPSCRFRYSLAKGGCMHFTCSQCKYEFCSGCSQPFSMGSKCGKTELCSRLGLHAHHPRNCLFYLRDKEPKQLQQLLQNNGVEYNTDPPGGSDAYADVPRRCRVPEQKETASGLKDDLCGRTVFPDNAGLCRMHYIEYLCGLVWKHKLDPVSISDASDLRQELRRHGRRARVQRVREPDDKYTATLRRMVETELPLDV